MLDPIALHTTRPRRVANLGLLTPAAITRGQGVLATAAIALTQAVTEADITTALRSAIAELAPEVTLRFRSIHTDGWQVLIDNQGTEGSALQIPLRAGEALLGELVVASAGPLPEKTTSAAAELSAHVALAMARLEFGRIISGHIPGQAGGEPHGLRDGLTSLPSRMLYHDRLEHALHRRARNLHPVGVLRLNLSGAISAVCEGVGQAVGDELLIHIAKRLQRLVRPSDTVARLGDDDFAAILDDLDSAADAALIAERLVDALSEPFILAGEVPLLIQVSIGVAVNTGAAESAIELLHKAETAMHSAKAAGPGCIEVHDHRFGMNVVDRRGRR